MRYDLFSLSKLNWENFALGSPLLIGLVFSLSAVVYFVLDEVFIFDDLLEVALPLLVGGVVVFYGVWMFRSAFSANRTKWISGFLFGGILFGTLTELWFLFIISLEHKPVSEPGMILLNESSVAFLVALPLGHYYTGLQIDAKQLKQETERLDNLASIITHDLRNPLNIAKGYAEMGYETGDEQYYEKVLNPLDRMQTILQGRPQLDSL